jgi:hypothetical protein
MHVSFIDTIYELFEHIKHLKMCQNLNMQQQYGQNI